MSFIVPYHQFVDDLAAAFAAMDGSGPVVIHTRTTSLGIVGKARDRQGALSTYWRAIQEAAGQRTLLFPTFTYDFCRGAPYNVATSPCQVGALNEHIRTQLPGQRTETPVFNFSIHNNRGISLETCSHPLSSESTLGEVTRADGVIAFLGVNNEANTFVHHLEEVCGVGYRYPKSFSGTVVGRTTRDAEITFRVRPLQPDVIQYDFDAFPADLRAAGLWHESKVGKGRIGWIHAAQAADYWRERLRENELYFLTPYSRAAVQQLGQKVGWPFDRQRVEAERG